MTTKGQETMLLLKRIKGQKLIGVTKRDDEDRIFLHFPDFVIEIKNVESVYVSPIIERIK